jgi:hypothetical protein
LAVWEDTIAGNAMAAAKREGNDAGSVSQQSYRSRQFHDRLPQDSLIGACVSIVSEDWYPRWVVSPDLFDRLPKDRARDQYFNTISK